MQLSYAQFFLVIYLHTILLCLLFRIYSNIVEFLFDVRIYVYHFIVLCYKQMLQNENE